MSRADDALEMSTQGLVPGSKAAAFYTERAIEQLRLYGEDGDAQLLTDARINCLRAVRLDPREEIGYYTLGDVWRRDAERSDGKSMAKTKWRQAADAYREAGEAAPGMPGIQVRQAMALFEAGEAATAQQLLADVLEMRGAAVCPEAACALAAVAERRGDTKMLSFARAQSAQEDSCSEERLEVALQSPETYAAARDSTPRLAEALADLGKKEDCSM